MAKEKTWYEVKVDGETLAKVKSKGLAHLVKEKFAEIYKGKTVTVE